MFLSLCWTHCRCPSSWEEPSAAFQSCSSWKYRDDGAIPVQALSPHRNNPIPNTFPLKNLCFNQLFQLWTLITQSRFFNSFIKNFQVFLYFFFFLVFFRLFWTCVLESVHYPRTRHCSQKEWAENSQQKALYYQPRGGHGKDLNQNF